MIVIIVDTEYISGNVHFYRRLTERAQNRKIIYLCLCVGVKCMPIDCIRFGDDVRPADVIRDDADVTVRVQNIATNNGGLPMDCRGPVRTTVGRPLATLRRPRARVTLSRAAVDCK